MPDAPPEGPESHGGWRDRVDEVATRLLEADAAMDDRRWRRPSLRSGIGGPAFIFEDQSEIPLAPADSHTLEYRMSWLARDSDVVGLADPRVPAFEQYLTEDFGLGRPSYLTTAYRSGVPLATRFTEDETALHLLAFRAARSGLTLVPYISTASAWILGERLAAITGRGIRVAGPPPELSERVNNKLWFAQRVRELLGVDALPPTHVASDERELKFHMENLASEGGQLVVKVPAASGGRGIVVSDSRSVVSDRVEANVQSIRDRLVSSGWDGSFPLVVGRWDEPVLASPSVQMWVPARGRGHPIVDGVFDQVIDKTRFIGALVSDLPDPTKVRLCDEALALGNLFQRLGYFGRCSLDAVLVGDRTDSASVHWLECNGRWGGVSTALTAVRRVLGRSERPFAVVQSERAFSTARPFDVVLTCLGADAFHRRRDGSGAIVLSPRRAMAGAGLNMVCVGSTRAEVEETVDRIIERF